MPHIDVCVRVELLGSSAQGLCVIIHPDVAVSVSGMMMMMMMMPDLR